MMRIVKLSTTRSVKLPVIGMSIGILTSKCAGISGIVSA
ncbi:Uncharacterised protein [Mycobacterium tuberculosis]|uniref:Uncharacterized protein n=1 Tax=Mycobacterium tuberculosis TaxID=1773 RepID=A0A654T6G9_MYCTX|nr:Uncharacterised protein [Mycobacterium tuberculosis]COV11568.1 Uncharacterised protein [Mycobacterium tuberculosis]COV64059.1 Uncharacterised protein [Mycobacterium tuberculosis]COW10386.1 Uncharacterised protein [Mycobacterium tuberculosis]